MAITQTVPTVPEAAPKRANLKAVPKHAAATTPTVVDVARKRLSDELMALEVARGSKKAHRAAERAEKATTKAIKATTKAIKATEAREAKVIGSSTATGKAKAAVKATGKAAAAVGTKTAPARGKVATVLSVAEEAIAPTTQVHWFTQLFETETDRNARLVRTAVMGTLMGARYIIKR